MFKFNIEKITLSQHFIERGAQRFATSGSTIMHWARNVMHNGTQSPSHDRDRVFIDYNEVRLIIDVKNNVAITCYSTNDSEAKDRELKTLEGYDEAMLIAQSEVQKIRVKQLKIVDAKILNMMNTLTKLYKTHGNTSRADYFEKQELQIAAVEKELAITREQRVAVKGVLRKI